MENPNIDYNQPLIFFGVLQMDLYNLFIIVYYMDYVGISNVDGKVYSSQEKAEKKVIELNKTPYAIQHKIVYKTMTLDRYITEERKQAVAEAVYPIE